MAAKWLSPLRASMLALALAGCVPYGSYGPSPYAGLPGDYYAGEAVQPDGFYSGPGRFDGDERPRFQEDYRRQRSDERQVFRQQQGYNQALVAQQRQQNQVALQQQQYNNAVVAQQNAYNQALLAQQRAALGH